MSIESQPKLPGKIYAEAVVRSVSGVSLLRSPNPITAQNVTQFYAQSALLNLAADRLQQAGFEVLDIGKTSINIAADPDTYERSFKTKLEAIERPVIKEMAQPDIAEFINSEDDRPFGEIDLAETGWDKLLDGIAINHPVYYQQIVPSAIPPPTATKYLQVPDELAQALNATLVHQVGITGKGVKVALIDSGCYPHPFFKQHHYKIKVALAPGAVAIDRDAKGHGTGVAANLLAIAPDVELTVVKADVELEDNKFRNINPTAAFRTALELNPTIISCSWGSDQRGTKLSPADRVLAAVIADAVRHGITVVCSAGNGAWGFPAQHPDVIAVGGVYRHLEGSLKGKLEASNYASSFTSRIFPGRQVPDVCGLVGQLPHGAYIMLPVAPRSIADDVHAAFNDGTKSKDGWVAVSGTSSAAPQIAGVCALMKQTNSRLFPKEVKTILQCTAVDVSEGISNSVASSNRAVRGTDLATGYGLVNTHAATQMSASKIPSQSTSGPKSPKFLSSNSLGPQELRSLNAFPNHLIRKGQKMMNPDYPKLKQNLDKILWGFEQVLEQYGVKELELSIHESSFVSRSLKSKTAYSLRKALDECFNDKNGAIIENCIIDQGHIMAAKSLLKLNKYQETAQEVITEVINNLEQHVTLEQKEDKLYLKALRELAFEALGEICGSDKPDSEGTDDFDNCDGGICLKRG